MKIIIEKNIPFIKGLLEPVAQVQYLSADDITAEAVRDADALMVRTRTRCDEALLSGSRVQFVATATIGTDHIDLDWCRAAGIEVANAPGCNAPAVAQYVFSAIYNLAFRPMWQHTIGIVGVGHVGSIVERWARQMDMRVLLCDPPRQAMEGGSGWSSLDEIAEQADIITFHTPLDASTRHMAGDDFLHKVRRSPIIINAARGPIVDTPALVSAIKDGRVHGAVIDCWEGEPDIDPTLLSLCDIATPHIAGYSYEGKVRATAMAVDALCRHFSLPLISMPISVPAGASDSVTALGVANSYPILADSEALKSSPELFEQLRNNYNLRHETGVSKID